MGIKGTHGDNWACGLNKYKTNTDIFREEKDWETSNEEQKEWPWDKW